MNGPIPITTAMLSELDSLRSLGEETLEQLIARAAASTLQPGELLIQRGEPNTRMYIVLSGKLRVDLDARADAPIARIGRGETVGELSLLGRQAASATVVAEETTQLLAIDEA